MPTSMTCPGLYGVAYRTPFASRSASSYTTVPQVARILSDAKTATTDPVLDDIETYHRQGNDTYAYSGPTWMD